MSGTSQAAPHVSAAVAMLLLEDSYRTPDDLKTEIRSMTIDLGDAGWDRLYGTGRIDFRKHLGVGDIAATGISVSPTSATMENAGLQFNSSKI